MSVISHSPALLAMSRCFVVEWSLLSALPLFKNNIFYFLSFQNLISTLFKLRSDR